MWTEPYLLLGMLELLVKMKINARFYCLQALIVLLKECE